MKTKTNIRPFELALLLSLCITLCHGVIVTGQQTLLEENIIRLHVIADGDTPEQQALKLEVRDRVLELLQPIIAGAETAGEARLAVSRAIPALERAAADAAGGQSVKVEFGSASYPLRVSESLTLPAGEYSSLRVTIGSGSGHNWWGVIFPCFRELTEENSAQVYSLIGRDNFALVNEADGVELRFHILELFARLREIF